jgi:hypothetical protein
METDIVSGKKVERLLIGIPFPENPLSLMKPLTFTPSRIVLF